jgi:hypothetical protein
MSRLIGCLLRSCTTPLPVRQGAPWFPMPTYTIGQSNLLCTTVMSSLAHEVTSLTSPHLTSPPFSCDTFSYLFDGWLVQRLDLDQLPYCLLHRGDGRHHSSNARARVSESIHEGGMTGFAALSTSEQESIHPATVQ